MEKELYEQLLKKAKEEPHNIKSIEFLHRSYNDENLNTIDEILITKIEFIT